MALTQQQTQELQAAIEQRRAALLHELREDVERVRKDRLQERGGAAADAGDEWVAAGRAAVLPQLRADVERVRTDRFEDLAGAAPDAGDESVAALLADLDHADVGRDLSELRGLEAARTRLVDGSYGTCADCGREIGLE